MATSKKTSKKKAAKKSAKKSVASRVKVKLNLPVDAAKLEAIHRCLAKGTLTITVSKADIGRLRLGDPYAYD